MTARSHRLLLGAAAFLATMLASATPVSAHAELVSSSPADSEIVATAPSTIELTFSESIDLIEPALRLVDASGTEVATSEVEQSSRGETMSVDPVEELANGTYVVAWQAVSADAHNIRGAFTFSVGEETAPSAGVYDDLFDSSSSSSSTGGVAGVGRFASYLGIAVLLGGFVMAANLVPAALASRRIGLLLIGAGSIAVVGTTAMISAQAALVGSSPLDWATVASTRSGNWWVIRLIATIVFCGLIIVRGHLTGLIARVGTGVVATGILAVVAAGGHGVTGRMVPLGFVATVVHLAAMTIWAGGLGVVVLGTPRTQLWDIASRFSPWALGSVAALSASGLANGWRQIGPPTDIASSSYGRWLLVKLAFVLTVVAVAAFSRRLVRERTSDGTSTSVPLALSAAAQREPESARGDDPRLRRTVLLEVVGVAFIVAATSGLVNSPPPDLSRPTNVTATAVVGDRIAQIELVPAVVGGTVMHVNISSPRGGLDPADEITVAAELPSQQVGPIEIEMIPISPGHVTTNSANFPVSGLWTIEITARYGEFDQVVFDVEVPVDS
jgi:copper transport protein